MSRPAALSLSALALVIGTRLPSVPVETLVYVGALTGLVCVAGFGIVRTVPLAVRASQRGAETALDGSASRDGVAR